MRKKLLLFLLIAFGSLSIGTIYNSSVLLGVIEAKASDTPSRMLLRSVEKIIDEPFIFTVDTRNAGSDTSTFILPCANVGTYNATIHWGDSTTSTITSYNDADLTHVYSVGGVYQIRIESATGEFGQILFNNGGDKLKILSIDQWGTIPFGSFSSSFYGCSNLEANYTDAPNLSGLLSDGMFSVFRNCVLWNGGVVGWDFSSITRTARMYVGCTNFNQPLLINTSSLENADLMLSECPNFDQDLSSWHISQITNFSNFLRSGQLSTTNYDALLVGWEANAHNTGLIFNAGTSKYTFGEIETGTTTSTATNELRDGTQNFTSTTSVGDIVYNTSNTSYARVISVDNDSTLTLSSDLMDVSEAYRIGSSAPAKARFALINDDSWVITDGGIAP